jgi:hypothetical protein
MFKWRVMSVVGGLLLPFSISEASACGASGWEISPDGGECLKTARNERDELIVRNACNESLEVSVVDCRGLCPPDMELSPGEERPLNLEAEAGANDGFRLTSSKDDEVTFTYVLNNCESEKGCNLGAGGSELGGGLATILWVAWVARRRARGPGLNGRGPPPDRR